MIQRKGDHAVPIGEKSPPPPEKTHLFYRGRPIATTPCKNCGETLAKDRWADGGWAHLATASVYCEQPKRARP
jgi:hypothetical protein